MKFKLLLAPAVAALLLMPSAASAGTVDLPATNPANINLAAVPVTQTFAAGTYNVQVVGQAQGGQYDAWSQATPAGGNFTEKYLIAYNGNTTFIDPYNGQTFATALDALNSVASVVTSFTLTSASDVTFSIPDYFWSDNTGGVSLSVNPAGSTSTDVPEPAMVGLFGIGVAALVLRSRRRFAVAA